MRIEDNTTQVEDKEVKLVKEMKEESKPFAKNDIVQVNGIDFRITRWDKGRLFLKLIRKKKDSGAIV